jgi:Uma2 family endonuclease
MTDLEIRPISQECPQRMFAADKPIDFKTWLELSFDLDARIETELVKGVMKERMAAKYPHEWIFMWFAGVLSGFVENQKLGRILGSRMAVKIDAYGGRLPDILLVRTENMGIIHDDAIYGTPDLVIEIISQNDRPSDLVPLEADYRNINVPEIVFIDPRKKWVRCLLKEGDDYSEKILKTGQLTLASVPRFHIEIEWLFADLRPDPYSVMKQLIDEANA